MPGEKNLQRAGAIHRTNLRLNSTRHHRWGTLGGPAHLWSNL